MAWKERATESHGSMPAIFAHLLLRFFQFVMALTVLGLYGTDLNNARIQHKYADSKWIYAEVVGGLAAVTSAVFLATFIKSSITFAWDAVLFILWVAVFGIFGNMYIKEEPEGDSGIIRMKNAVWIDLVNMLVWLITAIMGAVIFFRSRGRKSLHTGRANV